MAKQVSESDPIGDGFLKQFNYLPKLVVFDLDLTLWPVHVDNLKPPLKPIDDGGAIDWEMKFISLYPGVREILQFISQYFHLAIASRAEDINTAYQLLQFCQITSYFPLKEIYPASKSTHLKRLQARSGVDYSEILFFDDDKRNIRDSKGIGVQAFQVLNGLSWDSITEGFFMFSQFKAETINYHLDL